jgi:hypothetical protein
MYNSIRDDYQHRSIGKIICNIESSSSSSQEYLNLLNFMFSQRAVALQNSAFWYMIPRSLMKPKKRLGGTHCLLLAA